MLGNGWSIVEEGDDVCLLFAIMELPIVGRYIVDPEVLEKQELESLVLIHNISVHEWKQVIEALDRLDPESWSECRRPVIAMGRPSLPSSRLSRRYE